MHINFPLVLKILLSYLFVNCLFFSVCFAENNCKESIDSLFSELEKKEAYEYAKELTHSSLPLEEGSIFFESPESIFLFHEMNEMFQEIEHVLEKSPYITKYEMFSLQLNQMNKIAERLREHSRFYQIHHKKLAKFLAHSINALEFKKAKINQVLNRVENEGGKRLHFSPPGEDHPFFDQNRKELEGIMAKFTGEKGELLLSILLPDIGHRSVPLLNILLENVERFHYLKPVYKNLIQSKKNPRIYKKEYQNFIDQLSVHLDTDSAERELLIMALMTKEIDLASSDGKRWVEVKNTKHLVTLEGLQKGFDKKILEQAKKTSDIVHRLGLEEIIDQQIAFINCITKEAADFLLTSLKVQAIGCIKPH